MSKRCLRHQPMRSRRYLKLGSPRVGNRLTAAGAGLCRRPSCTTGRYCPRASPTHLHGCYCPGCSHAYMSSTQPFRMAHTLTRSLFLCALNVSQRTLLHMARHELRSGWAPLSPQHTSIYCRRRMRGIECPSGYAMHFSQRP
jgi:hypothetical protein